MAVWALRLGYVGLAFAIAGLIATTSWLIAVGVIIWLSAATLTLTGVFWARSELREPRPGLWPMRWMLLHDTVRPRSSGSRAN
jgi:hypothetical protein